jgi:hypothetical protein
MRMRSCGCVAVQTHNGSGRRSTHVSNNGLLPTSHTASASLLDTPLRSRSGAQSASIEQQGYAALDDEGQEASEPPLGVAVEVMYGLISATVIIPVCIRCASYPVCSMCYVLHITSCERSSLSTGVSRSVRDSRAHGSPLWHRSPPALGCGCPHTPATSLTRTSLWQSFSYSAHRTAMKKLRIVRLKFGA